MALERQTAHGCGNGGRIPADGYCDVCGRISGGGCTPLEVFGMGGNPPWLRNYRVALAEARREAGE